MTTLDLLQPLAPSIIGGIVVAVFNHAMTKRRERGKALAELRVAQLTECWGKIERAALLGAGVSAQSRDEAYDGLDRAVAKIRLLGTRREIEICDSFTVALSQGNGAAVIELLNELRRSLRDELGLESVPKMTNTFFRIHRD